MHTTLSEGRIKELETLVADLKGESHRWKVKYKELENTKTFWADQLKPRLLTIGGKLSNMYNRLWQIESRIQSFIRKRLKTGDQIEG